MAAIVGVDVEPVGTGVDLSRWQIITSWTQLGDAVDFIYVKVGDGNAGSVLRLDYVASGKTTGKPVGGYYFARNNGIPPEGQAQDFAKALRATGALDLPAILDLEGSGGFTAGGWAIEFGKRFLNELLRQGITRIGFYSNEWLATQLKPWDWGFPGLLLWIANYSRRPTCPHHVWQKSETGRVPGIAGNVDLNDSFVPLEAPMAWRVANSLNALFNQFNARYPNRNRASDGSIGDAAHATTSSDHNPWVKDGSMGIVTARDFTHDPNNGMDIDRLTDELAATRDPRIKYIIANGWILDSRPGNSPWQWKKYTGANPHNKHFHLSVMSSKHLYDDGRAWNLPSLTGAPPVTNPSEDDMPTVDELLNASVGKRTNGSDVSLKDAILNLYLGAYYGGGDAGERAVYPTVSAIFAQNAAQDAVINALGTALANQDLVDLEELKTAVQEAVKDAVVQVEVNVSGRGEAAQPEVPTEGGEETQA